jgi:hypothetical protein
MFQSLQELEDETRDIITSLYFIGHTLIDVSAVTYASGWGDLMKQAEKNINEFGNGLVAASNAVFTACSEVVNQLAEKFAPQGARGSYAAKQYRGINITTHTPDKVAIYPPLMKKHLEDLFKQIFDLGLLFAKMEETFMKTKKFWVGESADRSRSNFMTKLDPKFTEMSQVLYQIQRNGIEWVEETIKYEASLSTP